MKRIGCMLLAIVLLAAAFPLTAYAAIGNVDSMSPGAEILNDCFIEDFGNITLGTENNVLEIPILHDGFTPVGGHTMDASDMTQDIMNAMTLKFTDPATEALFAKIEKHPYSLAENARFILTAEDIGRATGYVYILFQGVESARVPINGRFIDPTINKKIEALTGMNLASDQVLQNQDDLTGTDLEALLVRPGDEIRFRLNTEFFDWDPDILNMNAAVRKSTLDNYRIGVSKTISKGKDWIEKIAIENIDGRAYVIVKFIDDFVSVDEKDFALNVTLTMKSQKHPDTTVALAGKFANWQEVLPQGVKDTDTSYGTVVEAEAALRDIRLEAGHDIYLYTTLQKGRKYYAKAIDQRSEDDKAIMEYYPEIRKTLTLKMVNITGTGVDASEAGASQAQLSLDGQVIWNDTMDPMTGTRVEIRTEDRHYVYDADGLLLGTTLDQLPLRSKYYLSLVLVDFKKEVLPAPEATVEDTGLYNPDTGAASPIDATI